ncbi:MAG: DUF808 domain-containing protein [Pseudomonadota bacterium]
MSGLLALLDDVAAIARLAAAQVDDIAAQAAKAGSKAAGVVIDDAAVTPKYVVGLPAARELPIVWKIARASAFNKIVILLPIALLLKTFAPFLLTPLLMLGGAYLAFEGAEKVWHALSGHTPDKGPQTAQTLDAAHLEEQRVKGAITTDFILSAEIMAITLAAIEADTLITEAIILAVVAIVITVAVYGAVAVLVKADDVGLALAQRGGVLRAVGRAIVAAMPAVMGVIATIGTVAMLWVGGNILVHGLKDLGVAAPYDAIHGLAAAVAGASPVAPGPIEWAVTAACDAVIALCVGLALAVAVNAIRGPGTAAKH